MRPLVLLVALSLAVILSAIAYPYLFPYVASLSREQAKAFVLDDLRPLEVQGVEARVVSVRADGGKWAVDVLLTRNAHSSCPLVDKRFYTLPPIGFRSESLLASCAKPVSIGYREEALIASAKVLSLSTGAYGCAFFLEDLVRADAAAYCPSLDESALLAFADGLPAQSWIVSWTEGGATRWLALSGGGQLLKTA